MPETRPRGGKRHFFLAARARIGYHSALSRRASAAAPMIPSIWTSCQTAEKRPVRSHLMKSSRKKPLVYLETSFVSYLTARVSRDEKVARDQSATRRWWEDEGPKCDLFVSELVFEEAACGDEVLSAARLDIIRPLRSVSVFPEVRRLADAILESHALPANSSADALHIALAAVYRADMLLTWNCRHMANSTTLPKTVETVVKAGYHCPIIATPLQRLEEINACQ